jgi:hypothetical protein
MRLNNIIHLFVSIICKRVYILTVLLSLGINYPSLGLEKSVLRHVQGYHGMEIRGGIALKGFCSVLDYSYHLSRNWQIKLGIGGELDEGVRTSFYSIFTQPMLAYTAWDLQDKLYLNILSGPIVTYETLKNPRRKKNKDNFSVGVVAGLEAEYFVLNYVAILVNIIPKILFIGEHDTAFDTTMELGLKFVF